MSKGIRKIICLIMVVGILGGVLTLGKEVFFPERYAYSDWAVPFNPLEHKFSFCKYELPKEYNFLGYHVEGVSFGYEKEILFYRSTISDQRLILLKLREHPKVDLKKIRIEQGKIRKTLNYSTIAMEKEGIQFRFLRPVWMLRDFSDADNDLILKGDHLGKPEVFETEKTQVYYVGGKFNEIGFDKHPRGIFRYPVPVIDFQGEQEGAVAVIKSKQIKKDIQVDRRYFDELSLSEQAIIERSSKLKTQEARRYFDELSPAKQAILKTLSNQTGETIFAIGYVDAEKEFDEEEFKQIVKSITFDAVFPGSKMVDLATPKSSQYMETTAIHQVGPFKWKTMKTTIGGKKKK